LTGRVRLCDSRLIVALAKLRRHEMRNHAVVAHTVSIQDQVGDDEWQARVNLAACYRLVARFGMSDLIYNHITAKVPGSPGHFLINPFGLMYAEITASSLYKIDLDGNVILKPETPYGINRAGYMIHSAVHGARPEIGCVMHTHTRAGMAVSVMAEGLLPLTQTAMRFHGAIGYHDYEVPTVDIGERERLARDLGPHYAMILRNHGLLACGRTVAEAFNVMYWLEQACKVQVDVMASGARMVLPSDELATRMAQRYSPHGQMSFGELEWPAMLRLLDHEDPSYRD
jgi:ribulose-5-phosphate 4-epimerase/fuculose-1-phosphate aldolase